MEITYRPGEKSDCAQLAVMIDIASGGVVEYLFEGVMAGMTPVQVVAFSLEKDSYPHSYNSAIVATHKDDVVGMALSYPVAYHKVTEEMRCFFPPERLVHLKDFYSSKIENTWFLDALCVAESHRRHGIGEKLISLTKEKAIQRGYKALSLIVFADNQTAISVYRHSGFEVVRKVKLEGNALIKHSSGCLLMNCKLRAG